MLRLRWIIAFVFLLQAAVPASGIEPYGDYPSTAAFEMQSAANAHEPLPPVVDWQQEAILPDDILYVRYPDRSKPLVFLVSLDMAGNVAAVRPIYGLSLYMKEVAEQIRKADFSSFLVGKNFVLRVKNPLEKLNEDWKLYRTDVCTPSTDLPTLYKVATLRIGRPYGGDDAAARCYKFILDRNELSVAARWGVAQLCLSKNDSCAYYYLQSLVTSNPEFIEARQMLADVRSWSDGDEGYVATLDEALALDMPLGERVALLNSQAFFLSRMDKIDDAIRVVKKLNASVSELLAIYPAAAESYSSEEFNYGLLEEAKGMELDAIGSYRLAASIARINRMVPDSIRYAIDLGLARTLRRSDDAANAQVLCDQWAKRRKKLITRHSLVSRGDIQEDGVAEVDGKWEFSCGNPEKGLELIQDDSKKYPDSIAARAALAQYYYSIGQIERARAAVAKAPRLFDTPQTNH